MGGTRGKLRVLKSFSGLELRAFIRHCLSNESRAFYNSSIQEVCLRLAVQNISADSRVVIVSLFTERSCALVTRVPEEN